MIVYGETKVSLHHYEVGNDKREGAERQKKRSDRPMLQQKPYSDGAKGWRCYAAQMVVRTQAPKLH